ncbi:hypothetical protein PENSPDRAFT_654330 [Peniophora sp. CONT]|nr:hypothetical protein PENSPDRAFT_654330 [Peniophora sp. CONT]
MFTSLGVDGQEQQPVNPSDPPGLRSVRVDDDRSSRENMAQDRDTMAVIAGVPGSSRADAAERGQERTA